MKGVKMIKSSKSSSSKGKDSSYAPYTLNEIDSMIGNFSKEVKYSEVDVYQKNFDRKLLYIIRDLLIRIEELEKKDEIIG